MIEMALDVIKDFFSDKISIDIVTAIVGALSSIYVLASSLDLRAEKIKFLKAPGFIFYFLGKLIFTKKSYERVVEPAITMMQEEYFEAYSQEHYLMARWIKFRFFFIFLQIIGINLPVISTLIEIKEKFTSK